MKAVMASYYTSIKTPLEQELMLSTPHVDPTLGLKVVLSVALIQNGTFKGVLALDLPLQRLFKEIFQLPSSTLMYAVLVDKEGNMLFIVLFLVTDSAPSSADVKTKLYLSLEFLKSRRQMRHPAKISIAC